MANLIRSKKGAPEKSRSRNNLLVEDLDPSSGWAEDPNNYYLLINLPHLKKDEVKLQTEGSDQVIISGERKVKDNKFVYFEKTFKVPENADTQKSSGKLEEGLLTVTIPKLPAVKKKDEQPEAEKPATGNKNISENVSHENLPRTEPEEPDEEKTVTAKDDKESTRVERSNMFSRGVAMISKNKAVIFAAFLAFSLGMLTSWKLGLVSA